MWLPFIKTLSIPGNGCQRQRRIHSHNPFANKWRTEKYNVAASKIDKDLIELLNRLRIGLCQFLSRYLSRTSDRQLNFPNVMCTDVFNLNYSGFERFGRPLFLHYLLWKCYRHNSTYIWELVTWLTGSFSRCSVWYIYRNNQTNRHCCVIYLAWNFCIFGHMSHIHICRLFEL